MASLKQEQDEYDRDPDAFWSKLADKLYWHKKYDNLKDASDLTSVKWFVGGKINLNYNALDWQIQQGYGEKIIIMHDCFYTKRSETFTYNQVLHEVSRLAGYLHNCGVRAGDNVLINMPMIPETLFASQACVRIGAVYSTIQRGYNADILKERIESFEPKVIFTANQGFYETDITPMKQILDNALKTSSHQPVKCIVFQRPKLEKVELMSDRDIDYIDARDSAQPKDCVPVESNSPLFVVHTSGSTGKPKGIFYGHGPFGINMLHTLRCLGLVNEGDVHLSFSQFGWIIGNLTYITGVFIKRTPAIIYEGPLVQPDVKGIYGLLDRFQVSTIFISCSNLRNLIKADDGGLIAKEFPPFKLKYAVVGGSKLNERDAAIFRSIYSGATLTQLYGQTELGTASTLHDVDKDGIPVKKDKSVGKFLPGYDGRILADDGTELPIGEIGRIAYKLPLPPGGAIGILDDPHVFKDIYFSTLPGYFDTKDFGKCDTEGYLYIDERSDGRFKFREDRFTTAGVEQIIMSHPDVTECAVVLKSAPDVKELIPVAFYRLKDSCKTSESDMNQQLIKEVRSQLGPAFPIDEIYYVRVFPKGETKILKGTIQSLVNSDDSVKEPPNADLPGMLDIWNAIKKRKSS